ncbi:MAG: GTP 3',8-cyclase MoaA [Acidimicrobiia bacterium]|nr:GTP 3',8-cyclase MoaA [Acidimicrobiia bacterium]
MNHVTPADTLGRPLRDLRISVTDRCSFRCVYCMPREVYDDHDYLKRSEVLTYDEIARIARIAVSLGVSKVRLTGGEPLLRREIDTLVAKIADLDGVVDLAMTTNGLQLRTSAHRLAEAGLRRVTVSLDAIEDAVFRRMIDTDVDVSQVLDAIDAAADAGLGPVKVNAVIRRGWNEDQVIPLADHFRHTGHIVRFIEYMDVGSTNRWRHDEVVDSRDLIDTIGAIWPIEPVDPNYRGEVAQRWRYRDDGGEVGFISSVSAPFCGTCTRLRLSAEGRLYTCLFSTTGTDLRGPLRSGATDADLTELIGSIWTTRSDRYSELRGATPLATPKVEMSYIGG